MSLIVAQSGDNQNPAFFRNNYKDGILFKEGSEISLVSISFNKDGSYNIEAGKNDRFRWIIGTTPNYLLHDVVLDAGVYTGASLAEEIEAKLNQSTVLKSYFWTVTFDQSGFSGAGSFTIKYDQQSHDPDNNINTARKESGTSTVTFNSNGTEAPSAVTPKGSNSIIENLTPDTASDNVITMNRGLFSNGGEVVYYINPVKSYTKTSFNALLTGTSPNMNINIAGVSTTFTMTATTGTPATAGWDYQLDDGAGNYQFLYLLPTDEGDVKLSFSTTTPTTFNADPTLPASWTDSFLYNPTAGDLRNSVAGDRTTANPAGTGTVISKLVGASVVPMNLTLEPLGYGYNKVGYVRNTIYQDGTIGSTQDEGFDAMMGIYDNPTRDGLIFRLSQMIQDPAINYPDAGWRGNSKDVFTNKTPSTFDTIDTRVKPTNWTNFTYGQDGLEIKVTIDQSLRFQISVAHDTGFNTAYEEETILAVSGYGDCAENIQEFMYPLRPCMAMNSGGRYVGQEIIMNGEFDDKEYSFSHSHDNTKGLGAGLKDVGDFQKLGAQFVMGALTADDIGSNPNQVPTADAPNPLDKYNINKTIGVERLITFPEGKVSNQFSTTQSIITSIIDEALIVELTDFNIIGSNGGTGDSMKIVACIPKEELSSNTSNGTISYYARFPIYVDLNLINDYKAYDLNIALRNLNGEIVSDVLPNTVASFVLREKDEIKQKRLMREQTEMLMGMRASQNQSAISQIGRMM